MRRLVHVLATGCRGLTLAAKKPLRGSQKSHRTISKASSASNEQPLSLQAPPSLQAPTSLLLGLIGEFRYGHSAVATASVVPAQARRKPVNQLLPSLSSASVTGSQRLYLLSAIPSLQAFIGLLLGNCVRSPICKHVIPYASARTKIELTSERVTKENWSSVSAARPPLPPCAPPPCKPSSVYC